MKDVCSEITLKKEKILTRWEQLSRERLPAATDKSHAMIRDHLPQLMGALCDVLGTGILEKPIALSETHGRQRFSFSDYTLSQVMSEYSILKEVIFDELDQLPQRLLRETRLITMFFDSAMIAAAVEFTTLREQELKASNDDVALSHSDLERFTAVAAHDLRSPAATIIGFSELAIEKAKQSNDPNVKYVEKIHQVSNRMIQLIDQLLEYTNIGKTETETAKKDFSLTQAAQDAVSNLSTQMSEAGAEVELNPMPRYLGNSVLFVQLFQNLIANSIKFRSPDRPSKIVVSASEKDNFLVIRVIDNGIGFAPEMSKELFEPFKRGSNSQHIKGSGLGLATVSKIAALHHGSVTATGHEGVGAEFKVVLPILG